MKGTISSKDFMLKSDASFAFFKNLAEKNDTERLIMLELWNLLNLEKKLEPITEDLGWKLVRKQIPGTIQMAGIIKIEDKEIGYYNSMP